MINKKKKPRSYYVFLQFEAFEFRVSATSKSEAFGKALKKLSRKSLKAMLDRINSSVDLIDYE